MRNVFIEVSSDSTVWSIKTSSQSEVLDFMSFVLSLDDDEDDIFCPDSFSTPVEVDMDLVREIEKGRIDV